MCIRDRWTPLSHLEKLVMKTLGLWKHCVFTWKNVRGMRARKYLGGGWILSDLLQGQFCQTAFLLVEQLSRGGGVFRGKFPSQQLFHLHLALSRSSLITGKSARWNIITINNNDNNIVRCIPFNPFKSFQIAEGLKALKSATIGHNLTSQCQ